MDAGGFDVELEHNFHKSGVQLDHSLFAKFDSALQGSGIAVRQTSHPRQPIGYGGGFDNTDREEPDEDEMLQHALAMSFVGNVDSKDGTGNADRTEPDEDEMLQHALAMSLAGNADNDAGFDDDREDPDEDAMLQEALAMSLVGNVDHRDGAD